MERNRKPPPAWDVSRAIDMWNAGKSGGQIADAVGTTRSAVLGLIWRRGLTRVSAGKSSQPESRKSDKPKVEKPKRVRTAKPPKAVVTTTVRTSRVEFKTYTKDDVSIILDKRPAKVGLSIIELGKGQCRYPTSPHNADKDSHIFCGCSCSEGEIYCDFHRPGLYIPIVKMKAVTTKAGEDPAQKQKGQE